MSNKDNVIIKMDESYIPYWAVSAPGKYSMFVEVQHENSIGVLPSDELVEHFVSNLVKLQKKINNHSKRQIC